MILLKRVFMKDLSEKGELRAARFAAAGAIVAAGYLGINPPGFVAQVVAFAFGLGGRQFLPGDCSRHFLDAHHQARRNRGHA